MPERTDPNRLILESAANSYAVTGSCMDPQCSLCRQRRAPAILAGLILGASPKAVS